MTSQSNRFGSSIVWGYGDPRDLHSFPTRRSSDLSRSRTSLGRNAPEASVARETDASGRSEEHTSELQTHVKLVCRPLLEKKNNRWRTHTSHSNPSCTTWLGSVNSTTINPTSRSPP